MFRKPLLLLLLGRVRLIRTFRLKSSAELYRWLAKRSQPVASCAGHAIVDFINSPEFDHTYNIRQLPSAH